MYLWKAADPSWNQKDFGKTASYTYFADLQAATFSIGAILSLLLSLRLLHLVIIYFRGSMQKDGEFLRWISSSSASNAEVRLKRAATRKLNQLMINAYSLHITELFGLDNAVLCQERKRSLRTSEQAVRNYVLHEEDSVGAGGLIWTWVRVLNGSLFDTEGIWLHTRLIWVSEITEEIQLSSF